MTFKETFDNALAISSTTTYHGIQAARGAFEDALRSQISDAIKESKWDYGSVNAEFLRKGENPSIWAQVNITGYYRPYIIEFKIKTKRGAKHYFYWEEWYDYSIIDYHIEKIIGIDMENSIAVKKAFEDTDILEFLNNVYDTDVYIQEQLKAKSKQDEATMKIIHANQDTVDALISALNLYKSIEVDADRSTVLEYIQQKTGLRIYNW